MTEMSMCWADDSISCTSIFDDSENWPDHSLEDQFGSAYPCTSCALAVTTSDDAPHASAGLHAHAWSALRRRPTDRSCSLAHCTFPTTSLWWRNCSVIKACFPRLWSTWIPRSFWSLSYHYATTRHTTIGYWSWLSCSTVAVYIHSHHQNKQNYLKTKPRSQKPS